MPRKKTAASGNGNTPADKRANFIRLGEWRVNKTLKRIDQLANLANRSTYEYTQDEVQKMFSVLHEAIARAEGRFSPKSTEQSGFQF